MWVAMQARKEMVVTIHIALFSVDDYTIEVENKQNKSNKRRKSRKQKESKRRMQTND